VPTTFASWKELGGRTPEMVGDLMARVEQAAMATLSNMREALAGSPGEAREPYRSLFRGGLRFSPIDGGSRWRVEGVAELDAQNMLIVSPAGFSPRLNIGLVEMCV
jgi:hypothetical protein